MSLLTTYGPDNRVEDQGATYEHDVEAAITISHLVASVSANAVSIVDRRETRQWHGTCRFSRHYRYVGMDKASATSAAAAIAAAYVYQSPTFAIGLYQNQTSGETIEKWIETGNAPKCGAVVTPVLQDGTMWGVEVSVDASVEIYADSQPSVSTLKGYFSSIANFPEGGISGNSQTTGD